MHFNVIYSATFAGACSLTGHGSRLAGFCKVWVCQAYCQLFEKGCWTWEGASHISQVEALMKCPAPTNKKELMWFLAVAVPLSNLLRMKVQFVWSLLCQQAFAEAKDPAAPRFLLPPVWNDRWCKGVLPLVRFCRKRMCVVWSNQLLFYHKFNPSYYNYYIYH